ncbi:CsiV family protein [Thalassotalea sp. PLHSN55]|uniref:CsiV family protein n=1 Tax=Thalassotalea sp. PLHSN55 TaxID=3435888 RepID=UPI003F8359D6
MTFNKLTLFIFSLCSTAAAFTASAANERWFEVEVILFSQLDDKSTLKEEFPAADAITPMPKYSKVIDLLAPYLQPDIASLKSRLPSCDNPNYAESLFIQASKPTPLFIEKSLADIEELTANESDNTLLVEPNDSQQTIIDENIAGNVPTNDSIQVQNFSNASEEMINTADSNSLNSATTTEYNDGTGQLTTEPYISTLTPEQVALVEQAEQAFADIQFFEKNNLISQGLTANKRQPLCRLPEQMFTELAKQDKNFDYDGFTLDAMPTTVNNVENPYSKRPYLLSSGSLQLHDIVKQLRLSRNFRPMLHMGWRHAPKDKKYAEAYKIYAGENLQGHYQKASDKHQRALALASENAVKPLQLSDLSEQVSSYSNQDHQALSIESSQSLSQNELAQREIEQAINAKIANLVQQAPSINENQFDEITDALDNPEKLLNFLPKTQETEAIKPPLAPLQPWYIDGLFRVHLNHYLYITADFSVMNHTLAQQATHALSSDQPLELKPIRFQQNKRVISGEIHYFDHPYMGMIVQIRKHKRPSLPEQ